MPKYAVRAVRDHYITLTYKDGKKVEPYLSLVAKAGSYLNRDRNGVDDIYKANLFLNEKEARKAMPYLPAHEAIQIPTYEIVAIEFVPTTVTPLEDVPIKLKHSVGGQVIGFSVPK